MSGASPSSSLSTRCAEFQQLLQRYAEKYKHSETEEESGVYAEELLWLHIYNLIKRTGRVTDAVNTATDFLAPGDGIGTYATGVATKTGFSPLNNKKVPHMAFNVGDWRGELHAETAEVEIVGYSARKVIHM